MEGLRAILVSPISPQNFVNLLFRTSCESDVRRYEVHRSTRAGFEPDASTRIGVAEADAVVKASTVYGHVPIDHRAGDYDHLMFQDDAVQPGTAYYYRVCAVDTAGQRGPFSLEAAARTVARQADRKKERRARIAVNSPRPDHRCSISICNRAKTCSPCCRRAAAAEIVVRFLRERVTIAQGNGLPPVVAEIWQRRQISNERVFEAVYVAALGWVGVAARVDSQGRAEFWTGSGWRPAPRPVVERGH